VNNWLRHETHNSCTVLFLENISAKMGENATLEERDEKSEGGAASRNAENGVVCDRVTSVETMPCHNEDVTDC
jgi:hypothetical protein